MRAMIEQGKIGEIRMVELQYTHGFSSTRMKRIKRVKDKNGV